jgi:hypothetical protein
VLTADFACCAQVFSPLFSKLISSSNLMELHVLVMLEAYFPNTTMLTVNEYDFMWSRLLTNLNHGALRHEHFSLHLAWLRQWLSRTVIPTEVTTPRTPTHANTRVRRFKTSA